MLSSPAINPQDELMATLEHLRPEGLWNLPVYSQVVVAKGTRMIYISGQVSVDEKGAVIGAGDLGAQTTQAMKNLGIALAAAGATFADVVKLTTFIVNYKPEDRNVIGRARTPFFANMTPPTMTMLGISALVLPEWLIEIEAVAVVD
jgi:enamine deaminase RidA (YjgF/YER057c/UK114 family)